MMFREARPMTVTFSLYVGVDIAATSFAATWASDPAIAPRATTFDQTTDGYQAFQQQLSATGVAPAATLVALEATGTYWVTLATHLHQIGYAVAVLNPAQVAQYARSLPRRAKTDALDAQLLLRFAAERKPARWEPPEQVYHELRQRLLVRDSMLHMRTQARNQRHAMHQWPVRVRSAAEALDSIITELEEQIDSLDREIAQVLADGAWATSATILLATPGLGPITTAWLLVGTLNFSVATTPEQLTAYVGLAPMPHESGSSVRGRRRIGHTGNGRLRTALYMATLNAARYNPTIKAFYQRLRAAGKPMKVARCAAARKLLHLAWALVKQQQHYCAPQAAQSEQLIT
jgi:transposase